jgi:hypothetical protein
LPVRESVNGFKSPVVAAFLSELNYSRATAALPAASGDTSPHWTKQRFNLLKPQTRENRPALDEVVLCVNLDKDKCRFFIPRYW